MIDNSEKIVAKHHGISIDDLLRSQRLFDNIKTEIIYPYTAIRNKKAFAMEIPGGSQSSRAASCLGMARGILGTVISEVINNEIKKHCIVLVKPTEVHKKATGTNVATKEQIMSYVTTRFKEQLEVIDVKATKRTTYRMKCPGHTIDYTKGEFEHIADAIVIAELGLERLMKE